METQQQFIEVNGLRVYCQRAGKGQPVLLLLHGSFLSSFSWRNVIAPLAQKHTVLAFDRAGFGLTSRPIPTYRPEQSWSASPYSPEAQASLTVALMDQMGVDKAILVGNSTGGTIALLTALRYPQRVQALVLVGAMVYSGYPVSQAPNWLRTHFPRKAGALLIRLMIGRLYNTIIRKFWNNPERVTPDILAGYRKALQMENWDRAMWELILSTHYLELEVQISTIKVPSLVLTGDNDRTVPTKQSIRLSYDLPNASLAVLPSCAHVPHEECPEAFLKAVQPFLDKL